MKEELEALLVDIEQRSFDSADALEEFRIEYLGRQGKMKDLMAQFREVAPEHKRELGPLLNLSLIHISEPTRPY